MTNLAEVPIRREEQMKSSFMWMLGVAALGFLAPFPVYGDSNLRCGDSIVGLGDTTYQVMSQCGAPDSREFSVQEEKVSGKKKRRTKKVTVVPGRKSEFVSSGDEIWHYDCGPDGYLHVLTFTKSRLSSIQTGGRGTRRGMPCPMSSEWTRRKEVANE
ncbi:MAG: DUF2845 domain-containing protein [Desulfobacteraceae bacterium]|nr:MAG: DUF2845 domain-containing protein [Desulfobacteraceae bacterium]